MSIAIILVLGIVLPPFLILAPTFILSRIAPARASRRPYILLLGVILGLALSFLAVWLFANLASPLLS
jgi:hypothetical protein